MTEQATEPLTVPTSGVRDGLGAVQDVDEGKRQVLVDIPWEVLDSYRSDFGRECFDEYLGQRMPVMCWQHLKTEPIGRAASWEKGARANKFVAQFSDFGAVPRAHQAFAQIRDGEITDFSFYYDQAKAIAHPNTRGAIRFTKARMPEISPVTVGSIPGAMATGVRQAADAVGVAELVRSHVITEEEGRTMLGLTGDVPVIGEQRRESITLNPGTASGARSVTITIGADGSVTTNGDTAPTSADTGDQGGPGNASDALAAVDGAIDAAIAYLGQVDLSSMPSEVGMAYQLLQAADVACDELMEAAGLTDYDAGAERAAAGTDDDSGERADKMPHGDVEYADPGYQDDKKKRYPVDTAEHVRAALSYIGQEANAAKYSADDLKKVKANITAAAKKFGIDTNDGKRSAADDNLAELDTQAALARINLGRR
jgi:phage head maturation protease